MKLKKSLLIIALTFATVTSYSAPVCKTPNADSMKAFELIAASDFKNLKIHLNRFTLDKSVRNSDCSTLYSAALKAGHEGIRKLLDEKKLGPKNGLELNRSEPYFISSSVRASTLFEYALAIGKLPAIKDLTRRGGTTKGTELYLVAKHNTLDVVKYFVDAGFDVNASGTNETILEAAISNEKPGMVRYLIDNGANVKLTESLTLVSAAHSSLEDIKLLSNEGVNYQYSDKVFEIACFVNDKADTIKYFITLGFEINRPEGQMSPLMSAAWGNTKEVVKVLLDAGADKNARDHRNMSAVDFALRYRLEKKGREEIIRLLQ